MRYFVGIALPEHVRAELVRIQDLLKQEGLFSGRFVRPENLHITMLFLGSLDEEQLQTISEKLASIALVPFTVQLNRLEVPRWSPAHVLWINLLEDQLGSLYTHLVTVLPEYKEKREFTGHCTLARIKKVHDTQALKALLGTLEVKPLTWEVSSFSLCSSVTRQGGPEYTLIKTYQLSSA